MFVVKTLPEFPLTDNWTRHSCVMNDLLLSIPGNLVYRRNMFAKIIKKSCIIFENLE